MLSVLKYYWIFIWKKHWSERCASHCEPLDPKELLHVNCEGCEYDVVQGLGDTGQLARISQVQLATHLMDYEGPSADFHEAVSLSLQVSVKRPCGLSSETFNFSPVEQFFFFFCVSQ